MSNFKTPQQETITHIATHASAISSSHGNLTIELPATLKYIGDYAFSNTKCLTKCDIPNGVEYIGTYAFYKSGLREVTLPASVKYVGYKMQLAAAHSTARSYRLHQGKRLLAVGHKVIQTPYWH